MTGTEIALIIAAIGTLAGPPLTVYLTGRAARLLAKEQRAALAQALEEQDKKLELAKAEIVKATNGVVDKLLKEKDKTADARAELSAVEGHEEGLKNGRTEARAESLEKRMDAVEGKKD